MKRQQQKEVNSREQAARESTSRADVTETARPLQRLAGNRALTFLMGAENLDERSSDDGFPGTNGQTALTIQRFPKDDASAPGAGAGESNLMAPTEATSSEAAAPAMQGFIVDDEAPQVGPGQMRKSDFLAQLKTSVCGAAEEALSGTFFSSAGCPWIEQWFEHYAEQDSAHVERALRRYAPEAREANSASEYIPAVTARVRRGISEWARTGETTGLPEELRDQATGSDDGTGEGPGAGMTGAVIGAASGLLGGALSAIGSVLFKRRSEDDSPQANPRRIQAQLGSGRPLDAGVSSRMGAALGADFSNVRVHSGAEAAEASDRLNARAFTIGDQIAFGAGEYEPGTMIGDALIAHELAHVVQQRGGAGESPLQKGHVEDQSLEEAADASAVKAVGSLWGGLIGSFSGAASTARSGLRLQRCSKEYTKDKLKEKIDGTVTAPDILAFIKGLKPDNQKKALKDLEEIRVDYVEKDVNPDAVAKINQVLQEHYRETAQTQAPAASAPVGGYAPGTEPPALLSGTHALSGSEKTAARRALTAVPSSGALPVFKPTIPAGDYETRIRDRVRDVIDHEYLTLVVGQGPAEHADPAKVYPMTRFQEIGEAAREEADKVFGSYSKADTFTPGVNLFDQFEDEETRNAALTDPADRIAKAKGRVAYTLNSDKAIRTINREHGAIPSRTTAPPSGGDSEFTILERVRDDFAASDTEKLLEIFRGWEGAQLLGQVFVKRFKKSGDFAERRLFWDTFQIMLHEYMHSLKHTTYDTYATTKFGEHSEEYNTLIEGMASALTEIAWTNIQARVSTSALRVKVEGPSLAAHTFDPATVPPINNRRYDSFDQAMALIQKVGLRNVYAAYFLGKVDLIGGP